MCFQPRAAEGCRNIIAPRYVDIFSQPCDISQGELKMTAAVKISQAEYRRLAGFRAALRKFLRFSEEAARRFQLSPAQHQLLLFVKGYEKGAPNIEALKQKMQIRHQSAVGLIDRCQLSGLVRRRPDLLDRRRVLIELTPRAEKILEALTKEHREELAGFRKSIPFR